MTVRTLPKFEHQTITVSSQISAYSIYEYVYMKWTTFLTATISISFLNIYKSLLSVSRLCDFQAIKLFLFFVYVLTLFELFICPACFSIICEICVLFQYDENTREQVILNHFYTFFF